MAIFLGKQLLGQKDNLDKYGEAKDGAETRTIEFVFTDTSISNERESNDTKDI